MRLEGKVELNSGAASGVEGDLMGFGGAAARLFAREGAKVVLTDINQESGQQTAANIATPSAGLSIHTRVGQAPWPVSASRGDGKRWIVKGWNPC